MPDKSTIYGSPVLQPANYALLHSSTTLVKGQETPSIQISLTPFSDSDASLCSEDLVFEWEITEFVSDTMQIKLSFNEAQCVSADTNVGDLVVITFND